jgi:hypothetical protein
MEEAAPDFIIAKAKQEYPFSKYVSNFLGTPEDLIFPNENLGDILV